MEVLVSGRRILIDEHTSLLLHSSSGYPGIDCKENSQCRRSVRMTDLDSRCSCPICYAILYNTVLPFISFIHTWCVFCCALGVVDFSTVTFQGVKGKKKCHVFE